MLEMEGLLLENPGTKAASILDQEGEQIRMRKDEVMQALFNAAIGNTVTFQFWLPPSDSIDVVSRYTRLADWLTVRQYWIDGLTADGRDCVISLVCSQMAVSSPRTIALVVDRWGAAEDTDWDAVVQERWKGDRFHADLYLMS